MPSLHTFATFTVVCIGLSLFPGPSNFFLVSQGAVHGRGRALACVAGIETAAAIRVLATAAGLSALLATSAVVFSVIRWAGVAYLALLGVRILATARKQRGDDLPLASSETVTSTRAMGKGLLVGLGNVKMAIFYLAFFPQFVHADRGSRVTQILILGAILWVIGLAGDLLYASVSAAAGRWIRSRPRMQAAQTRTEAMSYLALAGWTAISG